MNVGDKEEGKSVIRCRECGSDYEFEELHLKDVDDFVKETGVKASVELYCSECHATLMTYIVEKDMFETEFQGGERK